MKLGFLTAALPENSLEQAAKWGAESGFEAIEIACWPYEKAARRYAGVTHIDVASLNKVGSKKYPFYVGKLRFNNFIPGVLSKPFAS